LTKKIEFHQQFNEDKGLYINTWWSCCIIY